MPVSTQVIAVEGRKGEFVENEVGRRGQVVIVGDGCRHLRAQGRRHRDIEQRLVVWLSSLGQSESSTNWRYTIWLPVSYSFEHGLEVLSTECASAHDVLVSRTNL